MKQLLDFKEDGMKGLHLFRKHLIFPVAAASYSDWEEQQLSYLEISFRSGAFTTNLLCQWCINHHIQFRIIYPVTICNIFKNPRKYIKYLR